MNLENLSLPVYADIYIGHITKHAEDKKEHDVISYYIIYFGRHKHGYGG